MLQALNRSGVRINVHFFCSYKKDRSGSATCYVLRAIG